MTDISEYVDWCWFCGVGMSVGRLGLFHHNMMIVTLATRAQPQAQQQPQPQPQQQQQQMIFIN